MKKKVTGADFGRGPTRARTPNNSETPILSSVITTISLRYFGLPSNISDKSTPVKEVQIIEEVYVTENMISTSCVPQLWRHDVTKPISKTRVVQRRLRLWFGDVRRRKSVA